MLSLGCGADPAPAAAPRAPLLAARNLEPAFTAPAVWVYHPRKEAALHAKISLESGRTLFAGERGERWLVEPGGHVEPAARLAPETLVAIERGPGGFAFLGRSGTRYESEEPL